MDQWPTQFKLTLSKGQLYPRKRFHPNSNLKPLEVLKVGNTSTCISRSLWVIRPRSGTDCPKNPILRIKELRFCSQEGLEMPGVGLNSRPLVSLRLRLSHSLLLGCRWKNKPYRVEVPGKPGRPWGVSAPPEVWADKRNLCSITSQVQTSIRQTGYRTGC